MDYTLTALPFFNGIIFSNTKDTMASAVGDAKVTKEKTVNSRLFALLCVLGVLGV